MKTPKYFMITMISLILCTFLAWGKKTKNKTETRPSGLGIEWVKEISDAKDKGAAAGERVFVHYTGYLTNGTKFDSSVDRGKPFDFKLPSTPSDRGEVIAGWNEGVLGMKVGEKRKLTIPPNLGYGPMGSPPVIPPNATLIFDIERVKATN